MKKNKILVFGAAGFIGTYLIDELIKQKQDVVASDISPIGEKYYRKRNIPYVQVDITNKSDFEQLSSLSCDTVIHLAALQPANFSSSNYRVEDYININVNGTLNILEFCRKTEVQKIIYASSHRNTSGMWSKNVAIKESDGRALQYDGEYSMFSLSESTAQDLVQYYTDNYPINGIVFRLPPVYGFGPHLDIFKNGKPVKTGFQTFIENAKACKAIEMWGDSSVGRDIIYVKDVVSAFIKALTSDHATGLYNITSAYKLTLREEVETIARVFWGDKTEPVIVEVPEKPHRMDSFLYDNTKAQQELGWRPVYTFEKMLIDYRDELEKNRFGFLIEKRNEMFKNH